MATSIILITKMKIDYNRNTENIENTHKGTPNPISMKRD